MSSSLTFQYLEEKKTRKIWKIEKLRKKMSKNWGKKLSDKNDPKLLLASPYICLLNEGAGRSSVSQAITNARYDEGDTCYKPKRRATGARGYVLPTTPFVEGVYYGGGIVNRTKCCY